MRKQEASLSELFNGPESIARVRSYLGRVRAGYDKELRTKFFDSQSLETILQSWQSHLTTLESAWPSLFAFENDLAKKVGPMSIMKPLSQRWDDIESYYESILLDSVPISAEAINSVVADWKRAGTLRLKSQTNTVADMKKSTSSGNPFMAKKRLVTNETIPFDLSSYDDGSTVQELPSWTGQAVAILGWRGQEGGMSAEDVKQRVVWMFPYAVNIAELQLYQPLIRMAQRRKLVPAWVSDELVDWEITRLFDTTPRNQLIVCTDFTKFDQHFNPTLQDAARHILTQIMYNDSKSQWWLKNVFPIKYNIPLLCEEGTIIVGAHGMGSGSGGTNADETLVHKALQYEAAQDVGSTPNPHSMCLGDDGLLTYSGITPEQVMESYSRHGLDMNLDKQESAYDHCTYLRRWHHRDYRIDGKCVGVYSTCRALGRLAERERTSSHWSSVDEALRELSILENCKYHPLKEEFVQYVLTGSQTRLGLDIPNFFDPQRLRKEWNRYKTQVSSDWRDDVQSHRQSIADWWIVQYL